MKNALHAYKQTSFNLSTQFKKKKPTQTNSIIKDCILWKAGIIRECFRPNLSLWPRLSQSLSLSFAFARINAKGNNNENGSDKEQQALAIAAANNNKMK